jgi:hypothetical protein
MPPASGYWRNNPHSDDIDYQIEADYSGLMSPGMPNTASQISDKIGHIMNYGDGWYGGVYVGAMYSLAFISSNVEYVVTEALKTIPEASTFHKCISDVIKWHKDYPNNWKQTWVECEKKWGNDIGCPDGVFAPFNIDAVINSAYVVIGLLYGDGDFSKTIDIATRCGQDSDCNPATACGILGTILGYDKIPEHWMKNLREVENMNFAYTNISLNKTYKMSFDQALQVISRNGGKIEDEEITIPLQSPVSVRFEKSFEGLYPVERIKINKDIVHMSDFIFVGTGIVFTGGVESKNESYVAKLEVFIDGKLVETAVLPASERQRRNELSWNYHLKDGKHTATFKWLNPQADANINVEDAITYTTMPEQQIENK